MPFENINTHDLNVSRNVNNPGCANVSERKSNTIELNVFLYGGKDEKDSKATYNQNMSSYM
jgi:hypothetical protein